MKPWRPQLESDEGESVLELFLDVLLCGFGAALALVIIFSVLPKASIFAAKSSLASSASSLDNNGSSPEKPLLIVSLSIKGDLGMPSIQWELQSKAQALTAEIFRCETGRNALVVLKGRPSASKVLLIADKSLLRNDIYSVDVNVFYQEYRSSVPVKIEIVTTWDESGSSLENPHLKVHNVEGTDSVAQGEIDDDHVAVLEIDLSENLKVLGFKDNEIGTE
jgi:hypothetical protein